MGFEFAHTSKVGSHGTCSLNAYPLNTQQYYGGAACLGYNSAPVSISTRRYMEGMKTVLDLAYRLILSYICQDEEASFC